jgi:sec1 family domain-containing protein 1
MTLTLKAAQLRAIHRMLAFNEASESNSSGGSDGDTSGALPPAGSSNNQWKILIYDTACRSIISPILSVQQLRRRGVTLHLLLNSEREPIPDVPAIYFCRPTKENLAVIAQDAARGLYARSHLNFVTKLERSVMEDFAKLVVQSGSLETIASVHDQYLDFTCLENRLFSLQKSNSYVLVNGKGSTEEHMEQAMTEISYGLFSVVATLGQIPVIRCPKVCLSDGRPLIKLSLVFPCNVALPLKLIFSLCLLLPIQGGAPEMVARKLSRMISEHPTLLGNKSSAGRPLLVILDRNADLITPIQHCSTYQALIDDVLNHKANRVEFDVVLDPDAKRPKKTTKRYDLDPDADPFYSVHKFQPFPEAIEENGTELQDVTTKEQQIRSKTGSQSIPSMDPLASGASDLASAVESLPALLERKKQLEVHTSILQGVMNEVAARDVPQFYELESSLATGSYRNDSAKAKKDVLVLVGDPAKGNCQDKIRLIIVYALATGAKTADMDEVSAALQTSMESKVAGDRSLGAKVTLGLSAINYLKQLRSMHMIPAATDMLQELQSSSKQSESTMLSSLMAKATTQATGFLAKASDRVSSMLGKIHKHHATVVVENLCDMKPGSEDETYLYLDPRVKGDVNVAKLQGMTRSPVREAIAFVIGGGCYGEYQNLQMLANERRKISYGSTEIVDPELFLEQLGELGK